MNRMKQALVLLMTLSVAGQVNGTNPKTFVMPPGLSANDYLHNTIVLRVDETFRSSCSTHAIELEALKKIFASIGVDQLEKIFPNHQPPVQAYNEFGKKYSDLSLIYELHFTKDYDLVKTINALLQTKLLVYAEPKYVYHVEYNPNDPQSGSQQFLTRINAYNGWDVSKGDTNVIIGITDTGTDWDHPDLEANLKLNYADPINGIDDDADGYIDNYRGWDVGENDNNPIVGTCFTCDHGSHVSGCAAATTDNNTGVASPGFFCKFLPVKIANANGALTKAYEGIAYAADHGCQIINCSWGGGGGGVFGQNIIDYATINKNSLVIAAAGNNGSQSLFYPAAYNYILAVAATNSTNDVKASFSNYGTYIDVCAPGNNIFSTMYNDSYANSSGTSMASPITAGVAAIVKSYFPAYTGLQVGEQVRITADNIYGLAGNGLYVDKLGTGRINLFNALTQSGPSVRMSPINITDNNDNTFVINDTMFISGDFTNYLSSTTNLTVTISTTSTFVTIVDAVTTVGALGTLNTFNNNIDPFIVKINSNAPQNTVINFKLTYADGTYNDFQLFTATVNVDYLNITVNDVWTSNSSKGRLCYNGDNQTEGLGFDYISQGSLSYETGFMAGTASVIADNVRGSSAGAIDNDFSSVNVIQKNTPAIWSDFDTYGKFNDNTSTSPLGLLIDHRSFSWSTPPNTRFHIFEYKIRNNGVAAITNLFAGIFSDWDVQNYTNNKADEDPASKMGYIYCTDVGGLFAGIKLLTNTPFHHYAIDNISGGSGGLDLSNGFTDAEKYTSLSTNRATAGGAGTGNDVIDVVGTGPFNLNSGDSVTVAFALIAGSELSDLINSANNAQLMYDQLTSVSENKNGSIALIAFPNPSYNQFNLTYSIQQPSLVEINLYELNGRKVSVIKNEKQNAGTHQIKINTASVSAGVYLLEVQTSEGKRLEKISIVK